MKLLFCALALFVPLAPALAQDALAQDALAQSASPFDEVPPVTPQTVTMKNGIVVTPTVVPDDDVRSILDVKLWIR